MRLLNLHSFLLILLSFSSYGYAQNSIREQSLDEFLRTIENRFEVKFSYADDQIENLIVTPNSSLNSLVDYLNFLEISSPFIYEQHSDKNILIIPNDNEFELCVIVKDELSQNQLTEAFLKVGNYLYKPNASGQFKIPVNAKEIDLKIRAKGYAPELKRVMPSETKYCIEVIVSPFSVVLDEIILTNYLTGGIQKYRSGILKLDYESFGLLPGLVEPDVLQSIQALPGITSRQESVSYLNVRGGTHDQNLFLWDGIKMYHTSHFFGMISAFNPYMTKSVKLIKNGTSSRYGDGVSSVIDMRTKDSIVKSFKAEIGVNLINADVYIEAPLTSTSSIEFSFRESINDIWESPTYNQYFDKIFQNTEVTNETNPASQQNNEFIFYDATLNYKHKLTEKDYIKGNFFYTHDEFSLNRFEILGNRINTRSSELEQTNVAGGIYYNRNWSEATKTEVQFYTSKYNQNSINTNLLNEQSLKQINEVREIGVRVNLKTNLSSKLSLESGYQFNETGILNSESINNPGFFRETQNSILTNSLYSQLNYLSTNKDLSVEFGGRLNHFSKFDRVLIEPRFNLSYKIVDHVYLEVLAEQKSQVTSQVIDLQTDFLGVENRRWVLSNPNNRPIIQSQQISTGLNYVKPSWFINADVYYKHVEGITTQGQGFQNQFQFSQVHGSYEVKGIDFLINKNFDPISGWASYSISDNFYRFDALDTSRFQNNLDIQHVISFGLSYEKKGLKLSTGFNWHSGAPITLPQENQGVNPQQILFQGPNAERLPDYFRLDFSTTYNFAIFKNINALAGLSFWNVFGNSNIYDQFNRLDDDQNIQTFKQRGLNFTPNLVFRLKF
ncbi:TonB-dependent hemoglobin/transferrin/lactoferrin receptor family protein [Psychroflexus torquis ATCC 700755]|uniref:TonB-dependent hemoglobin/transferrin/lactoferrin receptor family protein n=1 Tax=Psychroflexus torquis (strain ATCC 700755 / CIP 106069 / ACAM 623) TaxID=313595 RepID=K4IC83_PSYTT|nr:TonB-dependent receptor plug domain-containing protein [Psychroflexus torquis]AFU68227.1 TonB-dependent hemoglobin/transferrin/lactoferrin receptor family protein [Psychroflexus torquis ATCC 700755]